MLKQEIRKRRTEKHRKAHLKDPPKTYFFMRQHSSESMLSRTPFPHLIIDNFLGAKELARAKSVVSRVPFERKEADLFSLEQTNDLTHEAALTFLKEQLRSAVPALATTFNVKLTALSVSAMRYSPGDYLLCHDDELEGRKIAYILYLNAPKKGGELLLRETKKPYRAARRIAAKENRLVLFKVSRKSWHEVAEVLAGKRVSVGGWFS